MYECLKVWMESNGIAQFDDGSETEWCLRSMGQNFEAIDAPMTSERTDSTSNNRPLFKRLSPTGTLESRIIGGTRVDACALMQHVLDAGGFDAVCH